MSWQRRLTTGWRRRARRLRHRVRNRLASPNPNATLIIGNQKSGTSAIAGLLAAGTGQTATIDFLFEIEDLRYREVLEGAMGLDEFVAANREEFSRSIVKEPGLTWLMPQLLSVVPFRRRVLVVRDPAQNIRSILDRVRLPGDVRLGPDDLGQLSPAWRLNVDCRWMGCAGDYHIEWLAHRWVMAARLATDPVVQPVVIRYEDFREDKEGVLGALAAELGLSFDPCRMRSADRPFQPAGAHRHQPVDEFFGLDNLRRIREIAGEWSHRLGYSDPASPT